MHVVVAFKRDVVVAHAHQVIHTIQSPFSLIAPTYLATLPPAAEKCQSQSFTIVILSREEDEPFPGTKHAPRQGDNEEKEALKRALYQAV